MLLNATNIKEHLQLTDSIIRKYKNKQDFFKQTTNINKSFLLVRHPFCRLVSAFRDKLERSSTHADYHKDLYYIHYGSKAVKMFRRKAKTRFGEDFFSAANNFGSPRPASPIGLMGNRTQHHPIFWEFVQLLKIQRPQSMDEHWSPIFHHCELCQVNYSHIFLHENLNVEAPLIRNILNPMHNYPDVEVRRLNQTAIVKNQYWTAKLYFRQLSERDILDLYSIYKLDFLIFGYKFKYGNLSLPQHDKI